MQVTTAAFVWHVRRRWAPRHLGSHTIWARFLHRSRKVRRRTSNVADVPDPGCAFDLAEGIAAAIAVLVVVLILIFIGLPFLIALGELFLIVLLALAGVVGRVLFRRLDRRRRRPNRRAPRVGRSRLALQRRRPPFRGRSPHHHRHRASEARSRRRRPHRVRSGASRSGAGASESDMRLWFRPVEPRITAASPFETQLLG